MTGGLVRVVHAMFCFILLAAQPTFATICSSNSDGNWNAAARWDCGHAPVAADEVVINGHTINLNVDSTVASLTINSGGTLQHKSGSDNALTVSSSLTVNGAVSNTGSGTFTLNAASVTNNGSLAADVMNATGDLVSNGALNVTTLNASGNVTSNGGATFTVSNLVFKKAGTQSAAFFGTAASVTNLTVSDGSSVTSQDYSTINLKGSLTNNGSLSLPNATLIISGSIAQSIGGANAATLGDLTMNNPIGLTLSQDLVVSDVLTLTSGIVNSTGSTLIVNRLCSESPVYGGSTASHVAGRIRLSFPNYGADCRFPVGSGGKFAPITVGYSWNAATQGGWLTGSTTSGDHPDTVNGVSGISAAKSVNRYWTLTPETGTAIAAYDATFQFCDSAACGGSDVDSVATPANFVVAQKTGAGWSTRNVTALTSTTRKVSGLSAFGTFVIGEAAPAVGVTCITDDFSSGVALWNVAGTGYTPQSVASPSVPSSRLRLTDNAQNRSTIAQLKKWFPAANNRVVIEFDYYVWGGVGSGADGVAMVLSDANVTPGPGGYGGSLGYANRSGIDGFIGGWLGIGLDEFGYYPNTNEGRRGYPTSYAPPAGANSAVGQYKSSVAVRGSGSGQASGYQLLANTGSLATLLNTTNALPQRYRVTLDHSNGVNAYLSVERDTGGGYVLVVPVFDVKAANSGQSAVPTNLLLSFTGSTGSYTNFHEIGNFKVCATTMINPGGSSSAGAFDCLETGSNTPWQPAAVRPLYTKLAKTDFAFDIAALKTDGTLETNFVSAGGNSKYVKVELFDDSSPAASCAAYSNPVAAQTVAFTSGSFSTSAGRALTGKFNLGSAFMKLRCRTRECVDSSCGTYAVAAPSCSTDQFAVRPSAATIVTAPAMASGPSASDTRIIKAGSVFQLNATTNVSYSGTLTLDTSRLGAQISSQDTLSQSGGVVGALSPSTLTANAAATNATYGEVGYLYLAAGAYRDEVFTAVDRKTGDCISSTANNGNLADTLIGGKYGCDIGNKTTIVLGRFVPDHFVITPESASAACGTFSYFGQDGFSTLFTLTAQNATNATTQNYSGAFARLALTDWSAFAFTPSSALPSGATLSASATAPSGNWTNGVATVSARHQVGRPDTLAGETAVTVLAKPVDADGVTLASASAVQTASTPLRYGRLKLFNAYGSEKTDRKLPMQVQYWSGKSWVINGNDTCTAASLSAAAFALYPNSVATGVSAVALSGGIGALTLTKPNPQATGYVDVAANLGTTGNDLSCLPYAKLNSVPAGLPWLRSQNGNCATGYDRDPSARVSFGVYSPETRKTVHIRELY